MAWGTDDRRDFTGPREMCTVCGDDLKPTEAHVCDTCADALWNAPCGLDCGNDLEDTEPPQINGVYVCAACYHRHTNGPDSDPEDGPWSGGFAPNH